jgi:hypothetical protein
MNQEILRRFTRTIKDRNLTAGVTLVGKYHKQQHTCQVVAGEGGKVRYRLEDGREFKSPSAAGMAITGHACDGWVFWSVETPSAPPAPPVREEAGKAPEATNTASEEKKETPVTPAKNPDPGAAKKSFHRTPNQKGVIEGQTRWYCQECGESFQAPYGEIPLACPQRHKA